MYSNQIARAMMNEPVTRPRYEGVVSRDQLKIPRKRPSFLISNTDVSSGPGKHWVVFYFPKKGKPEFFDSLGRPPSFYGFKARIRFRTNKKQLQASGSRVCGHYALFYALQRSRGIPMETILNSFGKNQDINDRRVHQYISSYFGLP